MRLKRLGLALAMIAALATPIEAFASLASALDSMWMTAGTNPTEYNSQTRRGMVFGSYSVRWPVKNYTIVNWDPPRIEAGCGGINIHLGSFTFIKAPEFKAMLRQIGSAATGYFFHMAISAICKDCNAALAHLADKINQFNLNNINTCKVGEAIGSSTWDAIGGDKLVAGAREQIGSWMAASNQTDDRTQSGMNWAASPTGTAASQNTNNQISLMGNLVWRVLKNRNAGGEIADPSTAFAADDAMNIYLMSLTGTHIINGSETTGTSPPATSPTSCPSGNTCKPSVSPWEPALDWETFIGGYVKYPNAKMFYCLDGMNTENDCRNVAHVGLDFPGVEAYVQSELFGSNNLNDPPQANSILDKMKTGTALTAQQTTFLSVVGMPLFSYFLEVQRTPGAMETVARLARPFIAVAIKQKLGQAVIKTLRTAYSGPRADGLAVAKPEYVNKTISDIQASLRNDETMNNNLDNFNKMVAAVEVISKGGRSFFFK